MPHDVFTVDFPDYASFGDTIEARVSLAGYFTGLRLVATLHHDEGAGPPDKECDGYWPSLDSSDPGYIGPKGPAALRKAHKEAESILQAWKDDEWHYCGVAVQAWFDDVELTGAFEHALWRIEMNYPGKPKKGRPVNSYLRETANELATECARAAIRALTEKVESSDA